MKLVNVRVTPNAKKDDISQENERLRIRVKAPAVEDKANKALIELLAKHFMVKKGKVRIVKGEKSREKVIAITE